MVANSKVDNRNIVFFDGLCTLCSSSVNFILNNERNSKLYFSSLQSAFAKKFLKSYGIVSSQQDSIIYFEKNRLFFKSDAVFKISINLKFHLRCIIFLKIFPKIFRDYFYNIISKNRYKWFGKKTVCYIPKKDFSNRFLDA